MRVHIEQIWTMNIDREVKTEHNKWIKGKSDESYVPQKVL